MSRLFFIFLFCLVSQLSAQWDPAVLDSKKLAVLQQPKYLKLKKTIVKHNQESWCSEEKTTILMDLVVVIKPKVCVEIGAFTGSSVIPVAAALNYLRSGKVYAVDAWSNIEAIQNISVNDPNYIWWSQLNFQPIKKAFLDSIKAFSLSKYCLVVHSSSQNAAKQIDGIDFLHLDGNFSEEGSLLDVDLYLTKVKSGGYVLLSNLFIVIDGTLTKMPTLWKIMDQCEVVSELDRGNTVLFRKN